MAIMFYNGSRIIPCPPSVSIQEQMQNAGDGERLGSLYTISIDGVLFSWKGSPDSTGSFYTSTAGYPADENIATTAHLDSLSRKMEAVRHLFRTDGLPFYFQSDNSSTPIACNPVVKSVNFGSSSDNWYDTIPLSIILETSQLSGVASLADSSFAQYISNANESWEIQPGEIAHIYQVTHNLSAVGKIVYSTSGSIPIPAWVQAKNFVKSRLGYDSVFIPQSVVSGVTNLSSLTNYNIVRTETYDDLEGTYSATESWTLASGTAIDIYTNTLSHSTEDRIKVISVKTEGTVKGLYSTLDDFDTGYSNAVSYFDGVNFPARISGVVGASGLNYYNGNVVYDKQHAQIQYSFEYDNRPFLSGAFEEFTVSQKNEYTDYRANVTVNGTIQGLLNFGEYDYTLKYPRAYRRWLYSQGQMYTRAITYASGVRNLQVTPIESDSSFDPIGGVITYSFAFNNRTPETAFDEFSVARQYSIDQGFTTYSINGNVAGYDISKSGVVLERYNNALAAMPTDNDIYQRISLYASGIGDITPPNYIRAKEITKSPQAGNISYFYTYTNQPQPIFSGCISENIVITNNDPGQVIAAIAVLARSQGPVLQDMLTFTARTRQISIELVFPPYSGVRTYLDGYNTKPDVTSIMNSLKPTGTFVYRTENPETWDWIRGRYGKNVTYTWEQ